MNAGRHTQSSKHFLFLLHAIYRRIYTYIAALEHLHIAEPVVCLKFSYFTCGQGIVPLFIEALSLLYFVSYDTILLLLRGVVNPHIEKGECIRLLA